MISDRHPSVRNLCVADWCKVFPTFAVEQECSSVLPVALATGTSVVLDEGLEVEILDHAVDDRVSEVDVRQLDGGLLRDEIHLPLSFLQELKTRLIYLFLKLERDASDGSLLNSLHKMRGITYFDVRHQSTGCDLESALLSCSTLLSGLECHFLSRVKQVA